MENYYPLLEKLGLSKKESAVYLTLLSLGSASVRKLAEASGINRGSAYDMLKSLREKGLVSYFHKQKKQYFTAEHPERLNMILHERQSELSGVQQSLGSFITELLSMHNAGGGKPVARFYEGKEGVRAILEEVLQSMSSAASKEYYVYSNAAVRDDLYDGFENYNARRIANGIAVKTISLGAGGTLAGLDERKWIPVAGETLTYVLLYNGKCAFISRDALNQLVGVIVENEGIYQTQKLIFLQLWNLLPRENKIQTTV